MALTVDAAKVLASRLSPESLQLLKSTSKSLSNTFDTALSDDYTYKAMLLNLVGAEDLPTYRDHKWRDLYTFFVKNTLEQALYSDDPVIVDIAIRAGADPSVNEDEALKAAAAHGNVEVLRRLLQDDRVDVDTYGRIALGNACESGNVKAIALLMSVVETNQEDEEYMLIGTIDSGNLDAVKFVLANKDINLATMQYNPIDRAMTQPNSDILKFFLDNADVVIDEENLIELLDENIPESVYRLLLKHPRMRDIIEGFKPMVVSSIIHAGHFDLVEELLDNDPELDVTDDGNEIIRATIDANNARLLKKVLLSLRDYIDTQGSFEFLVNAFGTKVMNTLLGSSKIDVKNNSSKLIKYFCDHSNVKALQILLKHKRVRVREKTVRECFERALKKRNTKVLNVLLNNPRTREFFTDEDVKNATTLTKKS